MRKLAFLAVTSMLGTLVLAPAALAQDYNCSDFDTWKRLKPIIRRISTMTVTAWLATHCRVDTPPFPPPLTPRLRLPHLSRSHNVRLSGASRPLKRTTTRRLPPPPRRARPLRRRRFPTRVAPRWRSASPRWRFWSAAGSRPWASCGAGSVLRGGDLHLLSYSPNDLEGEFSEVLMRASA